MLKPAGRSDREVRPPPPRARLVPGRDRRGQRRARSPQPAIERGYLVLDREWKDGDAVELNLPMPVQRIAANPEREGRPGPAGHPARAARLLPGGVRSGRAARLALPAAERRAQGREASRPARRRGRREGRRPRRPPSRTGRRSLYQAVPRSTPVPITAIPYYAWDNRKPGPMKVWLPVDARERRLPAGSRRRPRSACRSPAATASPGASTTAWSPRAAASSPPALCHWWPHTGTGEWAQYTWKTPVTAEGREGLLVRRHRPRRVPFARLLANRVSRRRSLEAGCRLNRISRQEGRLVRGELRSGDDDRPAAGRETSGAMGRGRPRMESGRGRRRVNGRSGYEPIGDARAGGVSEPLRFYLRENPHAQENDSDTVPGRACAVIRSRGGHEAEHRLHHGRRPRQCRPRLPRRRDQDAEHRQARHHRRALRVVLRHAGVHTVARRAR